MTKKQRKIMADEYVSRDQMLKIMHDSSVEEEAVEKMFAVVVGGLASLVGTKKVGRMLRTYAENWPALGSVIDQSKNLVEKHADKMIKKARLDAEFTDEPLKRRRGVRYAQ